MIEQPNRQNHRSKRRRSQPPRIIHVSIRPKSNSSRSVGLSDVLFDYLLNNEYSRYNH